MKIFYDDSKVVERLGKIENFIETNNEHILELIKNQNIKIEKLESDYCSISIENKRLLTLITDNIRI
jgi:hypothetical protein